MDLFSKKTWSEKLQLKTSNPASLWHFVSGGIAGLWLNLLFLIPFKMSNIWIALLACIIGSVIITSIEFGLGYLLFYVLKVKKFWDYSNSKISIFGKEIKLNYMGLIDVWHSLSWIGLTYVFYFINKLLN